MSEFSSSSSQFLTIEEYLARERSSRVKHEYVAGEVYAMSPQSRRHSTITLNIIAALRNPARLRGCDVWIDIPVRVAIDRYYYPDVVIECGPPAEDEQPVHVPCFVVEVTSPSTRATDLREKLFAYREVSSLQGYLVVEQKRRRVIMYTRQSASEWSKIELTGNGVVDVSYVDATLSLDQIYEGVDLPPMTVREDEDEYTLEDYERE